MKNILFENKQKIILYFFKILRFIIIFGLIFIILLPFLEIFITSIKSPSDLSDPTIYWIPQNPTFKNIISTYRQLTAHNAFYNSLMISFLTAVIQVIITAMAGYSFAKLKFKGNNIIFLLIMLTIFIPIESLNTSRLLFFTFHPLFGIKIIGSRYSIYIMTLLGMGYHSPIFIYIFRQYFRSISNDIFEQAQIDGANNFKVFYKIMLPNARGAILTTGILTFVWTYNDYYFPSLFNFSNSNIYLLSTRLAGGRYRNPSVSALMMIIPLLIIYMFINKYLLDSIQKTAIC